MNMLVNVLAFVPKELINHRYDGAVMGLFASAAVGTVFLYAFCKALEKFPLQGLPEIVSGLFPSWLNRGLLLYFAALWYSAGVVTLLVFADFTRKFLNPDLSSFTVTSIYLSIIVFFVAYPSVKVLHMLETLIVLGVPFTLFILFKSFFNKDMRWDDMLAVAAFVRKWPHLSTIAAGSYVFSGYVNMALFNRVIPGFKLRWVWTITLVGLTILCTTLFIPIGFLGADDVGKYTFAWISTADAMRIELGIIERVLFIFIFLYGVIAFASMIVHLHVALEFLKEAFSVDRWQTKRKKWFAPVVILLFAAVAVTMNLISSDNTLLGLGATWLNIRLPSEALLVGIMVYAAWRRNRC